MEDLVFHLYQVGVSSSIVLALFITFFLFRSKAKKRSVFLATILLVLAGSCGMNALLFQAHTSKAGLVDPFQLLIGPSFLLFLQWLNEKPLNRFYIHLLPFVLVTLTTAGLVLISVVPMSSHAQGLRASGILGFPRVVSASTYILLWVYYFLCTKALAQYCAKLKKTSSFIELENQAWIQKSLLALLLAYSAIGLVYLLNHGSADLPVNQYQAIFAATLIFYMGYTTLLHPSLFINNTSALPEPHREVEAEAGRYEKSGLTHELSNDIRAQLLVFMETGRPYLEAELNLSSLATRMSLSEHHLSQVINIGDENFYDFISHYRVNEVKRKLSAVEYRDTSILEIALASGFNSKATFNRAFKKAMNITPSVYRSLLHQKK